MAKDKLTSEKAKELLLKEQQENIRKCNEEIQAILKKYGFSLQVNHGMNLVPSN